MKKTKLLFMLMLYGLIAMSQTTIKKKIDNKDRIDFTGHITQIGSLQKESIKDVWGHYHPIWGIEVYATTYNDEHFCFHITPEGIMEERLIDIQKRWRKTIISHNVMSMMYAYYNSKETFPPYTIEITFSDHSVLRLFQDEHILRAKGNSCIYATNTGQKAINFFEKYLQNNRWGESVVMIKKQIATIPLADLWLKHLQHTAGILPQNYGRNGNRRSKKIFG